MKLKQDCIRDLLLYLEENLKLDDFIEINSLKLKNYNSEDLIYTTSKLIEADYINCSFFSVDNKTHYYVLSITYKGHLFLDNIRDEKVYQKTKALLSSFKSVSIEIFSETASKVIIGLIEKKLNL